MRRTFLNSLLAAMGLPLLAQTKVDYPSQIRGAAITPNFADAEIPSGLVNGSNNTFTLAHAPIGASLQLYRGGLVQTPGPQPGDFVLTGNTITFNALSVPQTLDALIAWYRY